MFYNLFNFKKEFTMFEKSSLLIVDDDIDVRRLLKKYLSNDFDKIFEAHDAESAILHAKNSFINVSIIDVGLPDISGLELINKLIETKNVQTYIIMTGNIERNIIKQALLQGAFGFIDKPCEQFILHNIVIRAKELSIYKKELNEILKFLICDYAHFSLDEYNELSVEQQANLFIMIKSMLSSKINNKKEIQSA